MLKLQLRSEAGDTLNFSEQHERGLGYQATLGLSGLGLPPVHVQWAEGAGDGAAYRRRRVLPRDIDLPLDILARDRTHLQALTDRLALALAGPCTLTLMEPGGAKWSSEVHRVGGGTYTYGLDTHGTREYQTVLTLRAGDPYWTAESAQTRFVGGASAAPFLGAIARMPVAASQAIGTISLDNAGTAHAYPLWEVTGPGRNFAAVSPGGERLAWSGRLGAGEKLTIDTRTAAVLDQDGTNRYSELDTAPRMWTIPPGLSTATAQLEEITPTSRIVCSWRPRKWMVI